MTKDQTVHFRNDIYAQDEQLLEATAEEAAFFNKAADHPLTTHMAALGLSPPCGGLDTKSRKQPHAQ